MPGSDALRTALQAMGMAIIMYGREEGADTLIEQVCASVCARASAGIHACTTTSIFPGLRCL
eukprot:3856693-Rhodomonas_salina.3